MTTNITPQLEHVFTIEAEIERARSTGKANGVERLHIPIIGGRVFGSKLNGTVLPGGSDWPQIMPDGHSKIEAHYTIETDDGTLIYVVNKGLRVSSSAVRAKLRAGETVSPDQFYMRGAPVFDAPEGPHRWLSEAMFICTLEPRGTVISIAVYRVN